MSPKSSRAERMVEDALHAHKLVPAQREWAVEYAAKDPEGFAVFIEHGIDYVRDRMDALTMIFLERARIDAARKAARRAGHEDETGPRVAALIERMVRVADVMSRDIDTGVIPPGWASARDQLRTDVRRLSKPLSKVRVDPLSQGKGGRKTITETAARRRLLARYGRWLATHPLSDRLTNTGLAGVTPRCDDDAVADDLRRAGWSRDDLEAEWNRRDRASKVERTG